jgi:hypothetical protein
MSYEILQFPYKFDFQMQPIDIHRNQINIGDKIRLFLYKPKSYDELVYKFSNKENKFNLNFKLQVKTLGKKSVWEGKIISKIQNIKIERYENSQYISLNNENFKVYGDIVLQTDDCENYINYHIENLSKEQVYIQTYKINEYLTIDTELKKHNINEEERVSGHIIVKFHITWEKYLDKIDKYPLESIYELPNTKFHIIRALYTIVDIKYKCYTCKHDECFDYKSSIDLVIPKNMIVTFKDIFQYYVESDRIQFIGIPTKDITDWDGCCMNPIVRQLVDKGDKVRCRIGYTTRENPNLTLLYRYYFNVLEVKGEYIWVELEDGYYKGESEFENQTTDIYLSQYIVIKICKDCIFEYPINWQNKNKQEILRQYLLDEGYPITGSTVE